MKKDSEKIRDRSTNPGFLHPRVCANDRTFQHLKGTPNRERPRETPMLEREILDGCVTDLEPDVDNRRATVRKMRSKCRCSSVLQFTLRRAVRCVLHRPTSQVIH